MSGTKIFEAALRRIELTNQFLDEAIENGEPISDDQLRERVETAMQFYHEFGDGDED